MAQENMDLVPAYTERGMVSTLTAQDARPTYAPLDQASSGRLVYIVTRPANVMQDDSNQRVIAAQVIRQRGIQILPRTQWMRVGTNSDPYGLKMDQPVATSGEGERISYLPVAAPEYVRSGTGEITERTIYNMTVANQAQAQGDLQGIADVIESYTGLDLDTTKGKVIAVAAAIIPIWLGYRYMNNGKRR